MKKGKIKISKQGCDFLECQLNENYLFGNVLVLYKDDFYRTGNRKHFQVELYSGGKFIMTVDMSKISLVKVKFEL